MSVFIREHLRLEQCRKTLENVFNLAMDSTKPPESQTPVLESEAAESSNCSYCFKGKELTINVMDMDKVNLVLSDIRTTVIGDNSQLNICKRCLLRQRVPQSKNASAECGVFTDGKGASCQIESNINSKRRRRKQNKSASKAQTTSKRDVDGNSADGENSDSDNADKFGDFLQCDSDD